MKKTLLLQTALVAAAGLFIADIADAQTKATPIGVTVGGYMARVFKMQDADENRTNGNSTSKTFGAPDAEIWFNIRGVLDNGAVVGGRIELEGATDGDQIDESYFFAERTDIGRVEIGSTDRATSKMVYGAPVAIPGYGTIDPTGAISVITVPTGARTTTSVTKFSGANDDAEGINLYTSSNRYLGSTAGKGLMLGVSYTPDGCQDVSGCGSGGFGSESNAGQISDIYTIGINYLESFGPVDLAVFGGYNRFSIEANNTGTAANGAATIFKSNGLNGYALGTTLTYNLAGGSSVQAGGAWKREEMGVTRSGDDKRNVYTAGLRYLTNGVKPGSFGLGVDYALSKADQGNIGGVEVAGEDELTWYSFGVTYQVATGLLLFGGVGQYEFDDAFSAGATPGGVVAQADNDHKATFGVMGVRLDF